MFWCNDLMSKKLWCSEREKGFKEGNVIFLTRKLAKYSWREG